MPAIDETHDPALSSWVEGAEAHRDFPIQNLPLGVFSRESEDARGGVAIGDWILDLAALADSGLLTGEAQIAARAASAPGLNALFALGPGPRAALRHAVSALLARGCDQQAALTPLLVTAKDAQMHLPLHVGGYTDFYTGIHHARAVGELFRPDQPLLPNYKQLPIAYHGRTSSLRASGAALVRPRGLILPPGAPAPRLAPTAKLDFELELALWIGTGNALGEPVPIARAGAMIAGISLLNDWSARDIQAFEYQPLGPFLSKNFLTSLSPWIVTSEALAPFRLAQPPRPNGDPPPPPHLLDPNDQDHGALALVLEVTLASAAMRAQGLAPLTLCRTQAAQMYWTPAQMVAHHTQGGCPLECGDVLGTGTISGPQEGARGSLLEITRNGAHRLTLPSGETRSFLEDGDEVVLRGHLEAPGTRTIGLGECRGTVVPAHEDTARAGN